MIFVLGSAVTLAASFFVFLQTKKGRHAVKTALYDLMYNVLAVKEILYDYMFIYQNKTGELSVNKTVHFHFSFCTARFDLFGFYMVFYVTIW